MITDADIDARLAALRAGGTVPPAVLPAPVPTYVKPLTYAAESLISALQVTDGIGLGLTEIDVLTRGFRPTDFVIVTGFAHSGKTQLINTMIMNNPDKRVLFISLDDPAEMILAKLIAMHTGEPAEQLERRVREGDVRAAQVVREAALLFPNLLVVDEVIGLDEIQVALEEATELWGAAPHALVVDYLEMLPGALGDEDGSSVKKMANRLKKMAKKLPCPLIALHQGTRSNARPGDPITMLSLGHSGEQQATIIVGCRRKKFADKMEAHERRAHEDTITVHVVKNKRPGGRLTHYFGLDFHMDAPTGVIRPLTVRPTPGSAVAAAEATRRDIS